METALPILTALSGLGFVLAAAVWLNRRCGFSVTPPPPPPATEQEKQWERERRSLKLCLRHPYC